MYASKTIDIVGIRAGLAEQWQQLLSYLAGSQWILEREPTYPPFGEGIHIGPCSICLHPNRAFRSDEKNKSYAELGQVSHHASQSMFIQSESVLEKVDAISGLTLATTNIWPV